MSGSIFDSPGPELEHDLLTAFADPPPREGTSATAGEGDEEEEDTGTTMPCRR